MSLTDHLTTAATMAGYRRPCRSWRLGASLPRFLADRCGITAVEFALIFPILLGMGLGLIEVGRFALLNMKLEQAANTIADLSTRDQNLTVATLNDLFAAVEHILEPFEMGSDGLVVVTGVVRINGGAPEVTWQGEGAGSLPEASNIGAIGENAVIPESIVMADGETLVAAEVFYDYDSWLLALITDRVISHVVYYRPRMGTLQTLS
ncbi:MAG: TadE/TadG family type IV pilus assembly protein [Pseudomonadota bacterium]